MFWGAGTEPRGHSQAMGMGALGGAMPIIWGKCEEHFPCGTEMLTLPAHTLQRGGEHEP